jgi:hypothetical protein
MKLYKCKICGFCRQLSTFMNFNDNGTITERLQKDFRAVWIESDFIAEVFKRIENDLGVSVQHVIFEAQKASSKAVINSNLKGIFAAGRIGYSKNIAINIFCNLAIWTGMGYAEAVVYKPKKYGEAILRNPFNREMMAANIVGAFEGLEKRPYRHTWVNKKGEELVLVRPDVSRSDVAERMIIETPKAKPGNRNFERCPGCGVPLGLSGLDWQEEKGVVMDMRLGVRMVFIDAYLPTLVFKELSREFGDLVYPTVVDAMKNFSLKWLKVEFLDGAGGEQFENKDRLYAAVLENVALRGQGNPVNISSDDGTLTVTVENPFNEHILAGHLAAMYELGEGRRANVDWSYVDESTIRFTLAPRRSTQVMAV